MKKALELATGVGIGIVTIKVIEGMINDMMMNDGPYLTPEEIRKRIVAAYGIGVITEVSLYAIARQIFK